MSTPNNEKIVSYDDLIASGIPLQTFAKKCGISNSRVLKSQGIFHKYQQAIRVLQATQVLSQFESELTTLVHRTTNNPDNLQQQRLADISPAKRLG